jgi:hypothetical protein
MLNNMNPQSGNYNENEQLENEEQAIGEPTDAGEALRQSYNKLQSFLGSSNRIFSKDETIASIERDREYQNNPFN